MKRWMSTGALFAFLLMIPTLATAGGPGYYHWAVSASSTTWDDNTPNHPGAGFQTLYLWLVDGCYPADTGGMSAAEFKIVTNWTLQAVIAQNGFIKAPAPEPNQLLAVGSCPTGPVIACNLLITADANPGRCGLTVSDDVSGLDNRAVVVDCAPAPSTSAWPEVVRFTGYATNDGTANQDDGSDCTTTSVEESTWGSIKVLYK